jgi:hypothetical protein
MLQKSQARTGIASLVPGKQLQVSNNAVFQNPRQPKE